MNGKVCTAKSKGLTHKRLVAVVREAIKLGKSPGFAYMSGLPRACKKARESGIKISADQQLRHWYSVLDDETFVVYLMDGHTKKNEYWAVFKLSSRKLKHSDMVVSEAIFKGFVEDKEVA